MAKVIWSDAALDQLEGIAEYIALNNPVAASSLVKNIFSVADRLEQFPRSGKKPLELSELDFREVISSPCRIFYRIDKQSIYIIYVMREERDLRKFLLNNPVQ